MKKTQKLKRGLKDLSPLFRESRPKVRKTRKPKIQKEIPAEILNPKEVPAETLKPIEIHSAGILTLFDAQFPKEGCGLNAYLASRLLANKQPFTFVSVRSDSGTLVQPEEYKDLWAAYKKKLARMNLSWEQFQSLFTDDRCTGSQAVDGKQTIIFDFDSLQSRYRKEIASVLDKAVFLIRPSYESIMATYKLIKKVVSFNPHTEYFVLFDGPVDDERSSRTFQGLAEITSKFLDIQLFWLGCLPWTSTEDSKENLSLEHLWLSREMHAMTPEKIAVHQFIREAKPLDMVAS